MADSQNRYPGRTVSALAVGLTVGSLATNAPAILAYRQGKDSVKVEYVADAAIACCTLGAAIVVAAIVRSRRANKSQNIAPPAP